MGKKSKGAGGNLGKALIRDRFGSAKMRKHLGDSSMLHTADINDGYDWGRLNLQSVTEESSFQEFFSTAQLAGTEFQAEKLNVTFINPKSSIGLLSKEEKEKVLQLHDKNKNLLTIPRRPKWDETTTAHELQEKEKEEFLEWRRQLALLQEAQNLILTPYEKNLEFWRQLWRVVERSDVIVQIVDARNPLLFRCEDLEQCVNEVDTKKINMILINKADFLTEEQRQTWADYFTEINLQVAFFSATLAVEQDVLTVITEDDDESNKNDIDYESDISDDEQSEEESLYNSEFASETEYESADDGSMNMCIQEIQNFDLKVVNNEKQYSACCTRDTNLEQKCEFQQETVNKSQSREASYKVTNLSELLTRDKLVSFFKTIYKGETYTKGITTIGLVGYPNVGKSSTINALLKDKKVAVSATPGKTKHFQTLFLESDLLLCDCPGLVMPNFICTKADMVLHGILPIDQLRDHVPSVTLLSTLIPRHIIEDLYGIMLPPPLEGEDSDRPPTAEELLNTYGYNRGFMTQNGQPDNPRSARYLLKDFVNGKLLYCVAPPSKTQTEYHVFPARQKIHSVNKQLPARAIRASQGSRILTSDLDRAFFQNNTSGVHVRGIRKAGCISGSSATSDAGSTTRSTQSLGFEEKPWKKINKHSNKKKREKTRRLYAHLDQH